MGHSHTADEHDRHGHQGFTLVELTVVVFILGVLIGLAVPAYYNIEYNARRNACFSNQRAIEGAVQTYLAQYRGSVATLRGVVDANHPLVTSGMFQRPPRCPAAPMPANLNPPDALHGAYSLSGSGTVEPCGFAEHGSYTRR